MNSSTPNRIENPTAEAVKCAHCNLKKICFPHGLQPQEMEMFEGAIDKTTRIQKKQHLFSRGDTLTSIYAIKAGTIKTMLPTSDGNGQILGFYLPGDLLGFDGFSDDEHKIDAVALEDTVLCKLPISSFESLCEILPGLRKVMMQQVGSEINRQQQLLLSLGQMQTEERLATYLLRLSCYFKNRGYSCSEFILPMSRNDLSNFLGMAPETLSRMFARLEKNGVMKISRKEVRILDMKALQELSFDICQRD
jgi:CRP/FNR family transcriptional regulator